MMTDEVAIPAGMKPWNGGKKPDDWSGKAVQFRSGEVMSAPEGVWKLGWDHSYGQGDIVAYTPITPEPAQPAESPEARAASRNVYLLQGDNARMAEALRQCRDQFSFYAREHYAAGKSEKGDTNTRFADIANGALQATTLAASTARPTERGVPATPDNTRNERLPSCGR